MIFIHPREKEITGEVVDDFITLHKLEIPRYKRLKELYESRGPILEQEPKEMNKPDSRLIVNSAKQLVDNYNGYFIGIPVKKTHEIETVDKFIGDYEKRNNMSDVESELSKLASIYGHSFEYQYQNELSETETTFIDPFNVFVVYDDTIQRKPLFAVRYVIAEDGYEGQLFTEYEESVIYNVGKETIITDTIPHYYGGLPIIEWIDNEERTSVYEPVETLINAINSSVSEKLNDILYFGDAYMAILGAEIDEEGIARIKDNRIINLYGTDDASKIVVEFLDKPSSDSSQENLLNRLERLIYEKSMVANINDESFGTASGTALAFKLQPMNNLAINKQRKVKTAMQKRFKLLFNLPTNVPANLKDEWMNIEYQFTRNMPRNLADEAETAMKLEGVVSKETQLSGLSIVDDPKDEIAKMEAENKIESPYDVDKNVGE